MLITVVLATVLVAIVMQATVVVATLMLATVVHAGHSGAGHSGPGQSDAGHSGAGPGPSSSVHAVGCCVYQLCRCVNQFCAATTRYDFSLIWQFVKIMPQPGNPLMGSQTYLVTIYPHQITHIRITNYFAIYFKIFGKCPRVTQCDELISIILLSSSQK